MKNRRRALEELLSEIAFAEERRLNDAERIPGRFTEWFDTVFTAITLAEAGELDTARDVMGGGHGGGSNGRAYDLSHLCSGAA